MAKIFITGSSDGLGLISARALIKQGHSVTLHARSPQRAQHALAQAPGAAGCLVGDLSSISQTKNLAVEANRIGRFDVVMHNAGMGYRDEFHETEDGIARTFAVNSLAPYILTCLMEKPGRLVYVSSGLHHNGDGTLKDITWTGADAASDGGGSARKSGGRRRWNSLQAYSDSKLQNVILAFAMARKWTTVESHACEPGWVQTKMGGAGAPGDAVKGAQTQIKLAAEESLGKSGGFWSDQRRTRAHPAASNVDLQEKYLQICEKVSGVPLP